MEQQGFSDEERRQFFALLKRYAEFELDQWARLKIKTKYGDVFIDVSRKPDEYPESWEELRISPEGVISFHRTTGANRPPEGTR